MQESRVVVVRHYEELVEMLVDLQVAADTLSRLTRDALVRLSSLASRTNPLEPGGLLFDDEASIP